MGSGLSARKKLLQLPTKSSTDDVSFDDFHVLRAIGKGSFGKVCIVQKRDTDQMFAMKYMNKSSCIEKEAFENVLQEIKILSSIEHPFLVNLWFTFQDEEDIFMVFDLLLGGDLRYHMQQSGCFEEPRVQQYMCEIALALGYLRSKNILHRDIKPDNILLDDLGHARITDFNIAIVLKESELATSLSGTKPYIAPEIFDCLLDLCPGYSFPADWWSLGICVYEMLCGQRPFDIHSYTTLEEVRQLFQTSALMFPVSLNAKLIDLMQRLLSIDSKARISNLEQMKKHPYFVKVDFNKVFNKQINPIFIPNTHQLNCDPTFELEEMIIETKPLHKKQKRLSKQYNKRESSSSISHSGEEMDPIQSCLDSIEEQFIIYNRERELLQQELRNKENSQESQKCKES